MDDIICRNAILADVNQCLGFQEQTGEDYWSRDDFEKIISSPLAALVVAVLKETVVGYCTGFVVPTRQNEGMLHETRVDLDYRREGVGTALVNYFCKMMYDRGCDIIYASITEEHYAFYVSTCGFEISSEQWIEIQREQH